MLNLFSCTFLCFIVAHFGFLWFFVADFVCVHFVIGWSALQLLVARFGSLWFLMDHYGLLTRGVATGEPGHPWPSHFNFRTRQGPTVSRSNSFYFIEFSEMIKPKNFTIFTVYTRVFGQFMAAFHFF